MLLAFITLLRTLDKFVVFLVEQTVSWYGQCDTGYWHESSLQGLPYIPMEGRDQKVGACGGRAVRARFRLETIALNTQ